MAYETLSALLDGECTSAEMDGLLKELENSPELKQQWTRLCLQREAREGTRVMAGQPCICDGVMAGLDAMPEEMAHPKVVELAARRKPMSSWASGWRGLGGLAAAASVAAVALLVGVPAQKDQMSAASAGSFVPQVTAPVSLPGLRRSNPRLQAVALRPEEMAQQDELNSLMIEHNSTLSDQGMGGTLRYARFAAHTADYRPQQDITQEYSVEQDVSGARR